MQPHLDTGAVRPVASVSREVFRQGGAATGGNGFGQVCEGADALDLE